VIGGWVLVVLGGLLALPQVVASTPWQPAIAIGLLLVLAGGMVVVDRAEKDATATTGEQR
jgi:hypothetical protein